MTSDERAAGLRLVELSPAALTALLADDLAEASRIAGVRLTGFFATADAKGVWKRRLDQIAADPEDARWIARAGVTADGTVVGHAGFHTRPDGEGRVEVAYAVDPAHRRQGHARAMLRALLARAEDEPEVRVVRAAISPDNAGSLATIAGHGFEEIGEQWDEEDGRELLFELRVR
ncbi:GNAT family N-acetyltransferase [Spirillospora sp. CA-253888]